MTLKNGLVIGGGTVYPELNFTLPDMLISAETMPEVRKQYTQMITEACKRAVELHAPGLVVEFELLPDLTLTPEWGAEMTQHPAGYARRDPGQTRAEGRPAGDAQRHPRVCPPAAAAQRRVCG